MVGLWVVLKTHLVCVQGKFALQLVILGEVHHLILALGLRKVVGHLDHPCRRGGGDAHQLDN